MDVSKQQKVILEAAMTVPGAFKPKLIGEKTGLGYSTVSTQLDRLVAKKILVKNTENKTFMVAEDARKEWANPEKPPAATIPTPNTQQTASSAPQGSPKVLTEESAGLFPYQYFKTLSPKIGGAGELVDVITDHVFNGGSYKDIKCVYR